MHTTATNMVEYWRKCPKDKRERIQIKVYRLFPVILQSDEHSIDTLPGEYPLGGEDGNVNEAILAKYGAGNYYFIMQYLSDDGGASAYKQICKAWCMGHKDNLPGFTNFRDHPPLISDITTVVRNHEQNIKSGYIGYLIQSGRLPGEAHAAAQAIGGDMADQAASTTAVGILGRVVEKTLEERDNRDRPSPAQTAPEPAWGVIDKTIDTVNKIHEKNAVPQTDAVALIDKLSGVLKQDPIDLRPVTDQITNLTNRMLEMQSKQMDNLQAELTASRASADRLLAARVQAAEHPPAQVVHTPAVVQDPLDALVATAEKMERVKQALGLDSTPRRRDDDDDDVPKQAPRSFFESLLDNLPQIITAGIGMMTTYGQMMHNMRVMQTGEGTTMPMQNAGAAPSPGPGRGVTMPPAGLPNPNPNPNATTTGADPMQNAFTFLRQIEPSLVGSLERNETGYEFAELFIRAFGRTGEFGYSALCALGDGPPFGNPKLPMPDRAVHALATALGMYPPLWTKIGAVPQLAEFLTQFVTFDEFMTTEGAVGMSIQQLLAQEGVGTVREYLQLTDDDDDNEQTGDGQDAVAAEPAQRPKRKKSAEPVQDPAPKPVN